MTTSFLCLSASLVILTTLGSCELITSHFKTYIGLGPFDKYWNAVKAVALRQLLMNTKNPINSCKYIHITIDQQLQTNWKK